MRITVDLEVNDEQLDILLDINNGIFDDYDSWINNARKMERAGLLMLQEIESENDPEDTYWRYCLTGVGFEALNQAAAMQMMN